MSKTCNSCGTEKSPASVPFVVHESTVARMERIIKRQWIALIVAICMIVGCNVLWLYAWMQYDYESYEITADGDSNANYIGEDGNIYNGGFNQGKETEKEEQ